MARRRNAHPSKSKTDLFTPTRRATSGKRKPGRPPVHDEAWTKVTVVLFNRQIVFLDRLAANIRAQTGAAISRAQPIRALLHALPDPDIHLTPPRAEAATLTRVCLGERPRSVLPPCRLPEAGSNAGEDPPRREFGQGILALHRVPSAHPQTKRLTRHFH